MKITQKREITTKRYKLRLGLFYRYDDDDDDNSVKTIESNKSDAHFSFVSIKKVVAVRPAMTNKNLTAKTIVLYLSYVENFAFAVL